MRNLSMIRSLVLVSISLVFLSSCSRNPVTGKREIMFMSESQEISMGKSYDPQVIAEQGLYEDKKLQAFINEKGKAMATKSHRPSLPYEFKIVDSPVVNAFAVPGGFVYFTRGIMAHFNNEAEFAGVLGHEIGHVTARHSAKQQTNQMLMQGALIGGLIASKDFRNYADVASQGLQLLSLKFSRSHESESDVLGVEYSTAIGYDAVEMADFFQTLSRLSSASGQSIPTFMSTHPNPDNRYAKVKQMALQKQAIYAGQQFAVNRDQYLRMIDGIVYGENPRQGFKENNTFYHPELKFQFPIPTNWQFQNTHSQVLMAPKDQKALVRMTVAQGTDLNAIANKMIQESKPNVVERKANNVNGLSALGIISEQTSAAQNGQQAQTIKILTYLIKYNGMVYKFDGMANKADFNRYFKSMRSVMSGFKKLTDSSKLNRQPEVVKIVTVPKTATLRQTLLNQKMNSNRLNELAILNGMQLTDNVQKGMLIKTVVERSTVLKQD